MRKKVVQFHFYDVEMTCFTNADVLNCYKFSSASIPSRVNGPNPLSDAVVSDMLPPLQQFFSRFMVEAASFWKRVLYCTIKHIFRR